jgi:cysteine synthase A
MKKFASSLIGNTPLIPLTDQICAKFELVNPSGSIKDRMALWLIDHAEAAGELLPGGTIVEATSGNTGIALSMIAAERGYKMIAVMPSNMSEERKKMIRAFGATIVEVEAGDFEGAVKKSDELVVELHAYSPNQFANPENVACHQHTTGKEIVEQVAQQYNKPISAIVAGTGTGGTLIGAARAIKGVFPAAQIIAVEPTESAVMSGGPVGIHGIQGIGDGFIPPIVDMKAVDKVYAIPTQDTLAKKAELAKTLGLFVGVSSAANLLAAERYVQELSPEGIVATIFPDRGERYLSMME